MSYSRTRYIMQATDKQYTIKLRDDSYRQDNRIEYKTDNVIATYDLKTNKPVILWCALLFGITTRSEFNKWVQDISDMCVDMSYGENDDVYEVWSA